MSALISERWLRLRGAAHSSDRTAADIDVNQSHIERELRQLHSLQWNVFFTAMAARGASQKFPEVAAKHMQRHRDAAEQTVCDALLKG